VKAREIPSGIMNFRNQDIFLSVVLQAIANCFTEGCILDRLFGLKKLFSIFTHVRFHEKGRSYSGVFFKSIIKGTSRSEPGIFGNLINGFGRFPG
jgi:hypothetical protein